MTQQEYDQYCRNFYQQWWTQQENQQKANDAIRRYVAYETGPSFAWLFIILGGFAFPVLMVGLAAIHKLWLLFSQGGIR